MNYHLEKTDENNSKKIFVFECSYFDQNQNINSSRKFTKQEVIEKNGKTKDNIL